MFSHADSLRGRLVLLLEENEALAGYIADGVKQAGATILGPARSINEANGLMAKLRIAPDAAVVSVDIFEAAGFIAGDTLARLNVPMLLIAGKSRALMPATVKHRILTTPFAANQVTDHLCAIVQNRASSSKGAGEPRLQGHRPWNEL